MRTLSFALSLLLPLGACGQTTGPSKNDADWLRVRRLSAGSGLHIKTAAGGSIRCGFGAASESELTCSKGKKTITVQRTEIRTISVSHRGRSALIGAAVGAGGGAIAGASTGRTGTVVGKGAFVVLFAIPLGVLGAAVGAATDFSHSTVYRAP